LIEAGPPEQSFGGLNASERLDRRDRLIWERLARLALGSPGNERSAVLEEIANRHKDWKWADDDRDAFLFWMEVRWGFKSDVTSDALAALPLAQLVGLLNLRKTDEGVIDRWNQVVKKDSTKGMELLTALAEQNHFDRELWSPTIYSLTQTVTTDEQRLRLLDLIVKAPQEIVESMAWEIGELLQGWSTTDPVIQKRILETSSILLDAATKLPPSEGDNLVTAALNAPSGKIATAVLEVLSARDLKRNV